jgi:hypothetical protein
MAGTVNCPAYTGRANQFIISVKEILQSSHVPCQKLFRIAACSLALPAAIEEDRQRVVRHLFEAQRRFAHLADARAQRLDVLGTQVGLVRKAGLQFVDRFGGDARCENLMETYQGIVVTFEPGDARFDSDRVWTLRRCWPGRQAAADR